LGFDKTPSVIITLLLSSSYHGDLGFGSKEAKTAVHHHHSFSFVFFISMEFGFWGNRSETCSASSSLFFFLLLSPSYHGISELQNVVTLFSSSFFFHIMASVMFLLAIETQNKNQKDPKNW
jgi:hypothetical protein